MIGKWDPWYSQLEPDDSPRPYGNTATYRKGAEWLINCDVVEDWGCGMGWFRQFLKPDQGYRGIDGSWSPFADLVADLSLFRSDVDGIFMRHVLEHNHDWPDVLDNALASFNKRMVLILFTPMAKSRTHEIPALAGAGGIDVPAYSFLHEDLLDRMTILGLQVTWEDVRDPRTWFGTERIYYLAKEES